MSAIGTEYGLSPFVTVNRITFAVKSTSCQRNASMLPLRAPVNSATFHHARLIGVSFWTAAPHAFNSSGEYPQSRAGIESTWTATVGGSGNSGSSRRAHLYTADSKRITWLLAAAPW